MASVVGGRETQHAPCKNWVWNSKVFRVKDRPQYLSGIKNL